MGTAQLMHQYADLGRVVDVVTVVHDHRPDQVLQHEGFKSVQVTVAEQVVGVELGGGDQQVLLGFLPARSGCSRSNPQRGLIAAHRMRECDQGADALVHLRYTANACGFGPYPTIPGRAPSGRVAVWTRQATHRTVS
jgi:hypothetical protein